jgi:c-di-GMP-binding flagellar brake protein YcgR
VSGETIQLKTLKGMVTKLLGKTRHASSTLLGLERRRSLRVQAEFSVSCTRISGTTTSTIEVWRGKTLNVSREGVLLRLKTPVEPFTLLAMQILLRNDQMPIQLVGESRWVRNERGTKSHRVGIAFAAIPAQLGERWAEAIYAATFENR